VCGSLAFQQLRQPRNIGVPHFPVFATSRLARDRRNARSRYIFLSAAACLSASCFIASAISASRRSRRDVILSFGSLCVGSGCFASSMIGRPCYAIPCRIDRNSELNYQFHWTDLRLARQLRQLRDIRCNPSRRIAWFANRTIKSHRRASFRVVPRAGWHTPCVVTSLTGLLDCLTAQDNESNHDENSSN
jgi:hypothetical protein